MLLKNCLRSRGFLWLCAKLHRRLLAQSDIGNVRGPLPKSFLAGNFGQLFSDRNAWDFHQKIAEKYGKMALIYGPFWEKQLYVFDPKALYHITNKDSHIFEESFAFIECNRILFGDGILSTTGNVHRKQRKQINPMFSVSHIRGFTPVMYNIARKMRDALRHKVMDGPAEVNLLPWMTRAALETIGQTALGYSFDSLEEGGYVHPYCAAVKGLIPMLFHFAFHREYLVPFVVKISSARFRRFVVDMLPFENACRLRNIIDTMDQTSNQIFLEKKMGLEAGDGALKEKICEGKDLMSLLMRANMEASDGERLTDKEVLGQMTAFIFAATDTTSNGLSRILYQLASHPEIQDRVRKEILEAQMERENLEFDELMSLPFLDAIVRETLRLYPPVPIVTRASTEDVILPLSGPITGNDGREMESVAIPKNTGIIISILMANRDTALWGPDVLEWKPDRWLSELPKTLVDARVPGVYPHMMTFMGGARACLGFKFSQLEIKIILSVLLSVFRLAPAKDEIVWEMGPLVTPNIKGQPGHSQLPIQLELL